MLGNYRVAKQLLASQVALSSTELVCCWAQAGRLPPFGVKVKHAWHYTADSSN
jgi:hypothetical protein